MDTIDWHPSNRSAAPRRRMRFVLIGLIVLLFLSGSTLLSYYVESLWFDSLGFSSVFWTRIGAQATVFALFTALTFVLLYGSLRALRPERIGEATGGTITINGQQVKLPVGSVIRLVGLVAALFVSVVSGLGMMAEWETLALWWYGGPAGAQTSTLDPIFGRPDSFFLFTLPAWQVLSGWFTTLAVLLCIATAVMAAVSSGARVIMGRANTRRTPPLKAVSIAFAVLLVAIAWRVYVGRFTGIFADGRIFDGINYTQAHVTLTGRLAISLGLVIGALVAAVTAFTGPRVRWLLVSAAPAVMTYVGLGVISWYVGNFIVRPNELVRETPFIEHNIEFTRRAYQLDQMEQQAFPAESSIEAADAPNNQETLQNIRLWDWRALQDTLRQIQAIRNYYDFVDIDIDRYEINGVSRQLMLAARELHADRLPESSRGWINEKLIYTHGYGLAVNTVNGFTPEGLPPLLVKNMPVESTEPALEVKRPEIYYGELTDNDVYVKTNQKEFNYPQGDSASTTVYEGNGGIVIGGRLRKLLLALDRGDITTLPFSDAITPESRLLMRRNIRSRVSAVADFLTFDPDPYIVIGDEGRLFWMMDGFTTSGTYPYSRHVRLGNSNFNRVNYVRNSVKAVIDAYTGEVTFYVFDTADPIIGRYRMLFPDLFKDASAMPPTLRKHVRYPEFLLDLQAAVYGLYHMTNPAAFYNREDLWSIASEVTTTDERDSAAQTMEANFVLMKLPGESVTEFVEILPFTPANRNNMIGWLAGRSDDPHYGKAIAYDFPKTRLVDGPLQVEARIDQNSQLSGQLTLWNQQGSRVRRGALIVIPVGKALLYAEPIYLQASRSPMPELRLVVLALQDRLAYGPTFEAAMNSLFGGAASTLPSEAASAAARAAPAAQATQQGAQGTPPTPAGEREALISGAARDLADYQRLTSEGRLGEAGQKLDALKSKLEQLAGQRR